MLPSGLILCIALPRGSQWIHYEEPGGVLGKVRAEESRSHGNPYRTL